MSYFGELDTFRFSGWTSSLWVWWTQAPWTLCFRILLCPFARLRGIFFGSFGLVLASFPAPLEKRSTGGCSDLFSCREVCCFFTVSDCLALITAFSKVSLGSSCSCSESFLSFKLTTILCRIRSSLNVPNSHYSSRQYKSVMKLITDSLSCWLLELNLALSNITFLLTTKWA